MKKYLLLLLVFCSCGLTGIYPYKAIVVHKIVAVESDQYFCRYVCGVYDIYDNYETVNWYFLCGEYQIGDTIKICK